MDPNTVALLDEISSQLMAFVCHNQKPFSKKLQSFVATGMHDIRAGLVAVDIVRRVREAKEPTERRALHLPVPDATRLLQLVQNSTFLMKQGALLRIEIKAVPAEPVTMYDGSTQEGMAVMVKANTALACGMGVGFLVALHEGSR